MEDWENEMGGWLFIVVAGGCFANAQVEHPWWGRLTC
jgi:hypothetical protein